MQSEATYSKASGGYLAVGHSQVLQVACGQQETRTLRLGVVKHPHITETITRRLHLISLVVDDAGKQIVLSDRRMTPRQGDDDQRQEGE